LNALNGLNNLNLFALYRWPFFIPLHLLLVGVAGAQHRDFVEGFADDLQRDGQIVFREAAGTDRVGKPVRLNGP